MIQPPTADGRRTKRREEILISAARTFRGRGFATASMAQIASDLGMLKSNLYYYFHSKEEILYCSHLHLMAKLDLLLDHSASTTVPPDVQLRRILEGFVHIVVDEFNASALTQNIRGMTPEHQVHVIALRDHFERHCRRLIRRGIRQKLFRPLNVTMAGFAIFGAINWIHRWHDQAGTSNSASIAKEFANFFLAGLRADGQQPGQGQKRD